MRLWCTACCSALANVLLLCSGVDARAATIVVPGSLENVEGNSNNTIPFENSLPRRYQQIYDASQFNQLAGPTQILEIAFRLDGSISGTFSGSIPDIRIGLSTTSSTPDHLSNTFAANVGSDATVVFNGPLTFSSPNTGPVGGPKPFDLVVTPQFAFFYDPQLGNLLLDIETRLGGSRTSFGFDAEATLGDSVSRALGSFGSATASNVDTFGLVTRFTFVPEPSTLALLGFGLAALRIRRRIPNWSPRP